MNKQQASQRLNEEFITTLKETEFPDDQLPYNFTHTKHAVLQHCSFSEINMLYQEYKVFAMKEKKYNLWEVCTVVNTFQTKTLAQLYPLLHRDYYTVLAEIMELEKSWSAIVDPIRERLQRKFDIMTVPPGMRKNGLIVTN